VQESSDSKHLFLFTLKGVGALEETVTSVVYGTDYVTSNGTIRILHQITIGDIAIVTVLSLLLLFLVSKWLLDNIWRGTK
jgi:hypothetical protein